MTVKEHFCDGGHSSRMWEIRVEARLGLSFHVLTQLPLHMEQSQQRGWRSSAPEQWQGNASGMWENNSLLPRSQECVFPTLREHAPISCLHISLKTLHFGG